MPSLSPGSPRPLTKMSKKEVLKLYWMISCSRFFWMPVLVWKREMWIALQAEPSPQGCPLFSQRGRGQEGGEGRTGREERL